VASLSESSQSPGSVPSIALDLSVLDHMYRIQAGTYTGVHYEALVRLRAAAEARQIAVWISEISPVEMLQGIEKIAPDTLKQSAAIMRDQEKDAIAASMGARTLGYPCSKLSDSYSRLGMSFRLAGPDSAKADELEQRLLGIDGVSAGDARQLVCCAFPFDGRNVDYHPRLHWFVAEDARLIAALNREALAGRLPELQHLRFGGGADFVASRSELL
jgi:hypothetical protein